MVPAEIYLAYFPYGDVAHRKLRPVLLLTPPVGPVPELFAGGGKIARAVVRLVTQHDWSLPASAVFV